MSSSSVMPPPASPREHVERIRRERYYIGRGEQNPLAEDMHQAVNYLSQELYSKDVHFLMELVQSRRRSHRSNPTYVRRPSRPHADGDSATQPSPPLPAVAPASRRPSIPPPQATTPGPAAQGTDAAAALRRPSSPPPEPAVAQHPATPGCGPRPRRPRDGRRRSPRPPPTSKRATTAASLFPSASRNDETNVRKD